MEPTYKNGERIFIAKKWIFPVRENDVVVAKDPRNKRLILKRIRKITNETLFYLLGDNPKESTDSRKFGWVEKKYIIGQVISIKA